MKVFIGADHNGFHLADQIQGYLEAAGYDVVHEGPNTFDPEDDFPVVAQKSAVDVVTEGPRARGILLCGSGQGVCIAANRFEGVRAALGYDVESVRSARNDDDVNVLCLPANTISLAEAKELVDIFLNTPFAGAVRFKRRIQQIDEYHG